MVQVVNRETTPINKETAEPSSNPLARIAGGSAKMPVPTIALTSAADAVTTVVPFLFEGVMKGSLKALCIAGAALPDGSEHSPTAVSTRGRE
jgi:hypothetical protein